MALIVCPECGAHVSNTVPACVKCGFPFQEGVELPAAVRDKEKASNSEDRDQSNDDDFPDIRELFNEKAVRVTERTVTVDGLSIRVCDISSVRVVKLPRKNGCAQWLFQIGLLFAVIAFFAQKNGTESKTMLVTGLIGAVLGGLMLAAPRECRLDIETTRGRKSVLNKEKEKFVVRVQGKISEAMGGRFGDRRNIVDIDN